MKNKFEFKKLPEDIKDTLNKFEIKYLTNNDLDKLCENKIHQDNRSGLFQLLRYAGLKVGIWHNDKLIISFMMQYGTKKRRAFITWIYYEHSMMVIRLLSILKKWFDEEYKYWKIYFDVDKFDTNRFKNHSKELEDEVYIYLPKRKHNG